jgi:hypothetical protein
MKRRFETLVFIGGSLLAFVASATTMLAMDVPALTKASDVVVRGFVGKVESRWTLDHSRIMTDSEIEVAEVLKGNVTTKTVTAMQPGGVVGDFGQMVHGTARFAVGEEVVVFLERRGERFFVVGMAQGRMTIDRTGPEAVVRGGEETLFLLDEKTHQPVKSPVQPMSLLKLVDLIRRSVGVTTPEPTVKEGLAPKAGRP